MTTPPSRSLPYALGPGAGWTYDDGVRFDVKVSEIAPGSGVAVLEFTTRHGQEPPVHTHATEDEIFYVLEGALTVHCAGRSFPVGQGGCLFLPRGLKHGYTLPPNTTVRLLVITAPVRDGASGGWGGLIGDLEKLPGALVASPPDLAT